MKLQVAPLQGQRSPASTTSAGEVSPLTKRLYLYKEMLSTTPCGAGSRWGEIRHAQYMVRTPLMAAIIVACYAKSQLGLK